MHKELHIRHLMNISRGKKEDFQKAIMEKGFYPEDLPPCFEVSGFFDAAKKLNLFREEEKFTEDRKKIEIKKDALDLSKYNASKRGFQRRLFSCANPLFYIKIASFFGKTRGKISKYLNNSGKHYSCSIPKIDKSGPRAIAINPFSEFDKKKRHTIATFPYLIKIDTSRFYSSLYTHAIPWAFHGKEKAKNNQKSGDLMMNELDKILRDAQRGQTVGIPIGPDTSRIIAEIVSVAIHKEFRKRIDHEVKGVRLIDDIVFGAENESRAHIILNTYREALRKYELDINEVKTKIIPSSQDLEPYWVFTIKRDLESKKDLPNVLDHIIRIANEQNDDGIVKFAIRQFDIQELLSKEWDTIEPFLMKVAMNFPHCLSYVVKIVIWAWLYEEKVDHQKWRKICHSIIKFHASLGHDSEVAWACWLLKNLPLKSRLTKPLLHLLLEKTSPFTALMAVDIANEESKTMLNEAEKIIMNRLSDHPMRESDWLLSYECERLFKFPLGEKTLQIIHCLEI